MQQNIVGQRVIQPYTHGRSNIAPVVDVFEDEIDENDEDDVSEHTHHMQ